MGTIIHLNPLQKATPPPVAGEPPPACEIVIFPGVRIEREETPRIDEAPGPQANGTDHGRRPRRTS